MFFEKLAIEKIGLDKEFDYKTFYNGSRGAIYKRYCKALVEEAIAKNVITIEKYVIARSIQNKLFQIADEKGSERMLLNLLKDYPQESNALVSPFMYILKKLDSEFRISKDEGKLKVSSNLFEVEICSKVDQNNAVARLYFPKENIAFTSTNDDVQNLVEVLAVKDLTVYVIEVDQYLEDIYAYKIFRDDSYYKPATEFQEKQIDKLFFSE